MKKMANEDIMQTKRYSPDETFCFLWKNLWTRGTDQVGSLYVNLFEVNDSQFVAVNGMNICKH